jgi:hypothetical protein
MREKQYDEIFLQIRKVSEAESFFLDIAFPAR